MATAESAREPVARRADRIRADGALERWDRARLVQEVHLQCGVRLLAAHRLARGWTLQEAVTALNELRAGRGTSVTVQMLNAWERGRVVPSLASLEKLCRLYDTGIERLGFGPEPDSAPATAGNAYTLVLDPVQVISAARPGTVSPQQLRRALAQVRGRFDDALERLDAGPDVLTTLEEITDRRTATHAMATTPELLTPIAVDFAAACALLAPRQPAAYRRRVERLVSQLAGMIGLGLFLDGQDAEAQTWFATGRTAAQHAGDRLLESWVAMYQAVDAAYFGDPEVGYLNARQATRLAGERACPAAVWGPMLQALALARMGRADPARFALRQAHVAYERWYPRLRPDAVDGFAERHLYTVTTLVHVYLRDLRRVWPALDRAEALVPPGNTMARDTTLMVRAQSLAGSGDVTEACRLAESVIAAAPPPLRAGILGQIGRELVTLVPPRYRQLECVQGVRGLLAATP